jgi:predicted house-cleaning NTP pyrophosphatase (Maf/HAM1 superfamily)
MSDTPETDHLEDQLGSAAKFFHPIIWRHARQLERERDEAREKYDTLAVENMLEVNKLCKERDEAREAFVIATDQMVIAQGKVREANKERDEAREQVDRYRDKLDLLPISWEL